MPRPLQRSLNSSSFYKPSCPSHSHLIRSGGCPRIATHTAVSLSLQPRIVHFVFRSGYVLRSAVTRRHWSRGDAQRDAPALGSRRRESGLEAGRNSSPHLSAYLPRSPAPDARPRRAREPLYGEPRAWPRIRGEVRRVYSDLETVRDRSEVGEYRVDQSFEQLGDQLIRLGFDTRIGANPQRQGRRKPR